MSMMFYQILKCNFLAKLYSPNPVATGIVTQKLYSVLNRAASTATFYLTLVTFLHCKIRDNFTTTKFFCVKII